jgi:hypothetical protein
MNIILPGKPEKVNCRNGSTTQSSQKRNSKGAKAGVYKIRVSLQYKEKTAEGSADFEIQSGSDREAARKRRSVPR